MNWDVIEDFQITFNDCSTVSCLFRCSFSSFGLFSLSYLNVWRLVVDCNSVNNHSIHTALLHMHSSSDVMLWPCPHSLGSVSAHCCTNCTTLLSKWSLYCQFFICFYNTVVMIFILCGCSSIPRTAFIFLHLPPQHFLSSKWGNKMSSLHFKRRKI